MRTPCLVEAIRKGGKVVFNPTYIEVLLPGTFRDASKDLTVIRLNSGEEMFIDQPLDEVLVLIAEATKPETE
jgi:hypothetical protein